MLVSRNVGKDLDRSCQPKKTEGATPAPVIAPRTRLYLAVVNRLWGASAGA